MCNNFPNIRITEGNNFSIILPLLSRTYVATRPIDEEIDPEQLENVVVTFGGVQYTAQRTERGVQIDLPATLVVGTYNILLTAEYLGSNIRAAYESAVTIVPWSEQSTAEQYIAGSPIVLRAAYVLGAPLSDAELEALKEEYREKNAQLQQAIADAEAAKREWEEKAADLDGVAKEVTAQEARDAALALAPVAQAAEAYNTGKIELAANITSKGVLASASETLPELAGKVAQIAQTETIIDGGEMYGAQQFGDGALWNLYDVLAQMKTRFMGTGDYAALIVCEYYKGYDSLQLQGADGYYTCDGDYYDYTSPTHVWHDADNGKANRWVAFLYRDEGARLDITNTAISPRSMYIGGHIGTIEYFVNGRLTELVSGVEETDIVDNFLPKNFTQEWGFNCIIRGIKHIAESTSMTINSAGTVSLSGEKVVDATTNNKITCSNAQFVYFPNAKTCNAQYNPFNCPKAIEIRFDSLISIYQPSFAFLFGTYNTLSVLYMPSLKSLDRGSIIGNATAPLLIDVCVGEMETNLSCNAWNPTNILADNAKKAQLIDNIKNHILARVSDATGGTQLVFTISTNMYNAIANENIEWQGQTMTLADAFLTKNWLLAGA